MKVKKKRKTDQGEKKAKLTIAVIGSGPRQ